MRWQELRFWVDGMPETKGSWKPSYSRKRGIVLKPDNAGEPVWAQLTAWAGKAALMALVERDREPDRRRYEVLATFYLPPRAGRKTNKRDLDKLARSALDALQGIIWVNDEQVDDLILRKRPIARRPTGRTPGACFEVRPVDSGF